MMTYEYFCAACQSAIELKHAFEDCGKSHCCPICGALMKRKYQTPAIIWQGRTMLKADGIDDHYVFPKMESVRREDKKFRGIDFNEQARTTSQV